MLHRNRGGPIRDTSRIVPRITDTSGTISKIDPIEVAKALGASRIVYVGNSKDLLDLYGKTRKMLDQVAASCDDYEDEPHDDPLQDD
jgi:F420-0:gamma-glutamyl ligase